MVELTKYFGERERFTKYALERRRRGVIDYDEEQHMECKCWRNKGNEAL